MAYLLLIAAIILSVLVVVTAVGVLAAFGQMDHYQSSTD